MLDRRIAIIIQLLCTLVVLAGQFRAMGQVLPASRGTAWQYAGLLEPAPEPTQELNILDFGAVADGSVPVNAAWTAALAATAGQMTVILFPAGEYLFTSNMVLPDSVIVRGEGAGATTLTFDLGGIGHCISFVGQELPEVYPLAVPAERGGMQLQFSIPFPFQPGDLLRLYRDDAQLVVSPWALGTTGQLVHVEQAGDATLTLRSPLRAYYPAGTSHARKVVPCRSSGLECLKIVRQDPTTGQWSNIWFNKAANCWVRGVESDMANFAHIEVYESTNCEISGSYLHHAFSYGSGGKGYGVNMTNTSGEVLVQDNIFERLRHSMLVQIGANGNVFAYNYSTDPFWQQGFLPANSAGDMVLHGDHPYLNLFEGNIVQNIVIDDSHGKNGPFNTFFRNRAELYGLVMSNAPPTDSVNFVGNEITGTFFAVQGTGHFQHGNAYQGNILPAGTDELPDTTYYLEELPAFLSPVGGLPQLGPQAEPPGTIPAKIRFASGAGFTICSEADIITAVPDHHAELRVYPNPFNNRITLEGLDAHRLVLRDLMGRLVAEQRVNGTSATLDGLRTLPPASYLLEVTDTAGRSWRWVLVKE
jgi:hypothetical protein